LNKAKKFFFEKKNQKTFGPAGIGPTGARARRTESFFAARRPGSFFSKKEVLACLHFHNPGFST
jgi:hypothetical protein